MTTLKQWLRWKWDDLTYGLNLRLLVLSEHWRQPKHDVRWCYQVDLWKGNTGSIVCRYCPDVDHFHNYLVERHNSVVHFFGKMVCGLLGHYRWTMAKTVNPLCLRTHREDEPCQVHARWVYQERRKHCRRCFGRITDHQAQWIPHQVDEPLDVIDLNGKIITFDEYVLRLHHANIRWCWS